MRHKPMKAPGPFYWDIQRERAPQKIPLRVVGYEEERERNQPRVGNSNWGDAQSSHGGRNSNHHRQNESN